MEPPAAAALPPRRRGRPPRLDVRLRRLRRRRPVGGAPCAVQRGLPIGPDAAERGGGGPGGTDRRVRRRADGRAPRPRRADPRPHERRLRPRRPPQVAARPLRAPPPHRGLVRQRQARAALGGGAGVAACDRSARRSPPPRRLPPPPPPHRATAGCASRSTLPRTPRPPTAAPADEPVSLCGMSEALPLAGGGGASLVEPQLDRWQAAVGGGGGGATAAAAAGWASRRPPAADVLYSRMDAAASGGGVGRLSAEEVGEAARIVSAPPAPRPAAAPDGLEGFVTDWYRWQCTCAAARAAAAPPRRRRRRQRRRWPQQEEELVVGSVCGPSGGGYDGALAAAAAMDISDADAAFRVLSGAAVGAALPLRQPPPALAERSSAAARPRRRRRRRRRRHVACCMAAARAAAAAAVTRRARRVWDGERASGGGGEGGEEMSEAEVLAELEQPTAVEFRNFQSAVISGEHFDCMLRLTPIRLAILSKQIEALSGRKPRRSSSRRKTTSPYWRLALARGAPRPGAVADAADAAPARRRNRQLWRARGHLRRRPRRRRRRRCAPPVAAPPAIGLARVGGVMRGASCGGGVGQMGDLLPGGERRVAPRTAAAAAAGVAVRRGRRRRRQRHAARLAKGRHPSAPQGLWRPTARRACASYACPTSTCGSSRRRRRR